MKAGGEGDDRGGLGWMASLTDSVDMSLSRLWEMVKDREAWHTVSPWGYKESYMTDQCYDTVLSFGNFLISKH